MEFATERLTILVPDPVRNPDPLSIRSYLSFAPYYRFLEQAVARQEGQYSDLYQSIMHRLEQAPELLQPVQDMELIQQHRELFQLIASTMIPVSNDPTLRYFSLSTPYRFENFFYSQSFSNYFSPDARGYVVFPPERPFAQVLQEYNYLAYRMIFRKCYQKEIVVPERRIHLYINAETGLRRYSRVHFDESFIELKLNGDLPPYPSDLIDDHSGTIRDFNQLQQRLPVSLCTFEGIFTRRSIADVTAEECLNEIRYGLIEMQQDPSGAGYQRLRSAMETLLGLVNVEVSLAPFLRLNEKFIYYDRFSGKSILLRSVQSLDAREKLYQKLAEVLQHTKKAMLLTDLVEAGLHHDQLNQFTVNRSYIVAPLFSGNELIGMIEAAAPGMGVLSHQDLRKFDSVYPFFEMFCRNEIARFHKEMESVVKDGFTALKPVVEWKFLDKAWNFLSQMEREGRANLETVRFDAVYPVYGAVDIRDSTVIRSRCYQDDLMHQLGLIDHVIDEINAQVPPQVNEFLETVRVKNARFRSVATELMKAEDESKINEYLQLEIRPFFRHLVQTGNNNFEPARSYLEATEHAYGLFKRKRKDFETSISRLNTAISDFLESEQEKLQGLYPHYFEKFRTDGVEYNIYLGESFSRDKPFDMLYLKSMRLWQLKAMAEIARMTENLRGEIPIPLLTTQLILVFGKPIHISFRRDERRFDADGEESIRYEILKKRIDKVKIKSNGQRLTEPGTISIVYTHEKEAAEYREYFDLIQKKHPAFAGLELHELEDVQGISGLKAIRILLNF